MGNDTERLDWLIEHGDMQVGKRHDGWCVTDYHLGITRTRRHETPRDAIDAAMAKEKPRE